MYEKYGKRLLDIIFSVLLLVVLSPLLLVVAVLVRVKLGKPVIFRQERPGKDDKIFTLYKFRTMTDARDEAGTLLPDSERLTLFGKKLRSTSIDELPELLNILKGDMSFVGPRPLLVQYLPLYDEQQRRRHEVRPGLTGLAQINGRNELEWKDRFDFDIRYVESVSLKSDFIIITNTLSYVLHRKGIYQKEFNYFDGNN